MNYFDPQPILFDIDGTIPTATRLTFYIHNTTTLAPIFAYDGVIPLANPLPLTGSMKPVIVLGPYQYDIKLEKQVVFLLPPNDVWQQIKFSQNISGTYPVSQGTSNVSVLLNVASAKAVSAAPVDGSAAYLLGGLTAGDGGGGFYMWVAGSTLTDDGGWTLQLNLGGAGRWIRKIMAGEDCFNIQIWQGAPSLTNTIDSIVSKALLVSQAMGYPIAFTQGIWTFNGPSFNFSTGSVRLNDGAQFNALTNGTTITFSTPTDIRSLKVPFTYDTSVSYVFTALASCEYIYYHWFGSYALAVNTANASNIPLYFKYPTSVPTLSVYNYNVPVVFGPEATLTNVDTTASHYFNQKVTVLGGVRRVFFESSDAIETYSIFFGANQESAYAWWFGFNFIQGNNQSVSLQRAVLACSVYGSGATLLTVNVLTGTKNISGKCFSSSTTNYCKVYFEGTVTTSIGADVEQLMIMNTPDDILFNLTYPAPIHLVNEKVYPEWFGANTSLANNLYAINAMLSSASVNANTIDGQYKPYSFNAPLTVPAGLTYWNMEKITLQSTTAGSTPLIASDSAYIAWKNVNVSAVHGTNTNASVSLTNILNGYLESCTFTGFTVMSPHPIATMVEVSKCHFQGTNLVNTFYNAGSLGPLHVHHCDFNVDNIINIVDNGLGAIANIWLCDNNIVTSSNYATCDIFVKTATANTHVIGLKVLDNSFTGLPDATNVSSTYNSTPYLTGTFRINPATIGAGSWDANFTHTMIITNNVANGNCNFCRKTIGSGPVLGRDLGASAGYQSGIYFDSNSLQIFFLPALSAPSGIVNQQCYLSVCDNEYSGHPIGRLHWASNYLYFDSSVTKWAFRFFGDNEIGIGNNAGLNATWRIYS